MTVLNYVFEKLKKEYPEDECPQSDCSMNTKMVSECQSEPVDPSKFMNYDESKDHVLEKLKKEYTEDECSQSDYSMNTKIVSEIFDERDIISERANNISTHRCGIYFAISKKVTKRSREIKNVPKLRKVAKTGAERIREYRARIIALENAASARSATNVEGMAIQTKSQKIQYLEDLQVDMRQNQRSLLYEALTRQSSQIEQVAGDDHRHFVDQVDVHQHNLPLFSEAPSTSIMQMQSSTEKVSKLRRHSKTAKTPAERARAYRERKKAFKNATIQQLTVDTIH